MPSITSTSAGFQLQPIFPDAISDIALFLQRWHGNREPGVSAEKDPAEKDLSIIEQHLRWLLLDNPQGEVDSLGYCSRDREGGIVGAILNFPSAFRLGGSRLLGLCSGNFFVEPEARMQGFFLFKRYLSAAGFDFFFGTTCNEISGALWSKLGGTAVPETAFEYILPINLEVMLPAFFEGGGQAELSTKVAAGIGKWAVPVAKLFLKQSSKLLVERCQDWEKIADLFQKLQPKDRITADRSVQYLQWRYGQGSPNHSAEFYVFRDSFGNEGWFCMGDLIRGRRNQIRGRCLYDAVWPREKLSFKKIFSAILQSAGHEADAVFFLPRLGVEHDQCSRYLVKRRLDAPRVFALGSNSGKGRGFAASQLDLVPADGDSCFRV